MKIVFWDGYLSDETMMTFAPIIVYWLYAGFYHMLSSSENFKLHTSRNDDSTKNLVPLSQVVKGVLFQQFIQATVTELVLRLTSRRSSSEERVQPSIYIQIIQILTAMVIMDTWQYFLHRLMHHNKFLYKHINSHHHKLIVPYAIGALYNHPLEAIFLDTLGGVVCFLVSRMTPRTAVSFLCFTMVKAVDDHCGLWLPGINILHLFFQNNSAYHFIHHQVQGTNYNFSQPFFSIWDKLLGTHMGYKILKRQKGGYEVKLMKV